FGFFLITSCEKDQFDFDTSDQTTTASIIETNQETIVEDDEVLGGNRIIVVGTPTKLAQQLGTNNVIETVDYQAATTDQPTMWEDNLGATIKGANAILINAKNETNLKNHPYVKAALQNGVSIIAEGIAADEMAALGGIGVENAKAAIIRTKGSTQQIDLTVITDDIEPLMQRGEGASMMTDEGLTSKEVSEAQNLHDADFEEQWQDQTTEHENAVLTVEEVAQLVNRGISLHRKAAEKEAEMIESRSGGFDFSTAGITFTTLSKSWTSNKQSNGILIAFDVQMVAAVSPYYKKYLRIRPTSTSYFKPGSQQYNSWTDKGYYQDACEIGIGYTSGGSGFALDRKAPNNANGSSTITTSTQFGISSNIGASLDGPSAGVGMNYSEGTSETRTVNDFNVSASNTSIGARFKYHYSTDWTTLRDWRWTGTPVFSSRQAYVKDVASLTKNQLTPYADVVLTALGAFNGTKEVKVDLYHRTRRVYVSSQSWPNANWKSSYYYVSYDQRFNVNFAMVNYPHMAIDAVTSISSQYPDFNKSRAVDGFTSGESTAAATHYMLHPYIDVNLPSAKYIYDIDIWNAPGYDGYLKDYYIFVSDQPFTSTDPEATKKQSGVDYTFVSGQSPRVHKWASRRSGKYVRIQGAGEQFLVIGEIALNPRRRGQ
ncbi:MAG: hypothetical protein AAGI23_23180, partial [Bacteroidota bacterium]